jgi:hypothetical protein
VCDAQPEREREAEEEEEVVVVVDGDGELVSAVFVFTPGMCEQCGTVALTRAGMENPDAATSGGAVSASGSVRDAARRYEECRIRDASGRRGGCLSARRGIQRDRAVESAGRGNRMSALRCGKSVAMTVPRDEVRMLRASMGVCWYGL